MFVIDWLLTPIAGVCREHFENLMAMLHRRQPALFRMIQCAFRLLSLAPTFHVPCSS